MVFDTDVVIWAFRGNSKAANMLNEADTPHISIISYMELIQGARDKQDLSRTKFFLGDFSLQTLPLSENIGHRAAIYLEEYCLKTALDLEDALIAATAVENQQMLCTANIKHFKQINDLEMVVFKP